MKTNLKIVIVALVLIFTGASLNAQEKKVTAGVKAGMNLSTITGDADGADSKFGYHVGVTIDYEFSKNLFILTGIEFTTKGAKENVEIPTEYNWGYDAKISINPMYLQVPIHFGYKLDIASETKMVFRGGPYIAYGVGGKAKLTSKYTGNEKVNIFRTDGYKNFDFGFGLGTGVEYKKYAFNVGYDFGVINIDNTKDKDERGTFRNGNFHVGLGYKF